MPKLLTEAGAKPDGSFEQQPGTNLTAASTAAKASAAILLSDPQYLLDLGGNWTVKNASIIGNYGSFYQARYQIAGVGYLALTQDQAIYPSYLYRKTISISADQAALFTFSAKPKVSTGGFWSMTAYSGDGYLVPNSISRYALGDRSNLTFPDGAALNASEEDRSFQILVQPSDVAPPANWTSNWLPAPAGGGSASLSLRLYGAEDVMTNGPYIYPKVEIINAVVEI